MSCQSLFHFSPAAVCCCSSAVVCPGSSCFAQGGRAPQTMPKPKMPPRDDEPTKWQRTTAHNLEWYKKTSKELEDEETGTIGGQVGPPSPPSTTEPAAASSSWEPRPPPFPKGVQHPGALPKTPAEDNARLRLGGGQALSFVQKRHITMVCGRAAVVPGSSKAPRLSISMSLRLPPCAEASSSLCLICPVLSTTVSAGLARKENF